MYDRSTSRDFIVKIRHPCDKTTQSQVGGCPAFSGHLDFSKLTMAETSTENLVLAFLPLSTKDMRTFIQVSSTVVYFACDSVKTTNKQQSGQYADQTSGKLWYVW